MQEIAHTVSVYNCILRNLRVFYKMLFNYCEVNTFVLGGLKILRLTKRKLCPRSIFKQLVENFTVSFKKIPKALTRSHF